MIETTQQNGVLGIVRNAANNASILFPLYSEVEKQEVVSGFGSQLQQLVPSMLEMISGAVDPGDKNMVAALLREAREERGLGNVSLLGPITPALEVHQVREDNNIDFSVTMFLLLLNRDQEEALLQKSGTVEYSDRRLRALLGIMGEKPLRPLARAALHVAADNNFWKQV